MTPPHAARITVCALLLGAGTAWAQNEADGRWHGGISLGGSVASGNSSSQAFNLTADGTRTTEADKINLYLLINQASGKNSNGERTRTAELYRGGGRYDYNIGERLFAFGGGEAEANRPGGIHQRVGVNGGLGYRLLRSERNNLDVFGGIGHSNTRFTDGTRLNGAEWLVGEESQHKLGESTTVKQRLAYYPGTGELGDRATFDASLSMAISGGWTFNTGVGVRHTSRVAPGVSKNERLLTWGFGYKY